MNTMVILVGGGPAPGINAVIAAAVTAVLQAAGPPPARLNIVFIR